MKKTKSKKKYWFVPVLDAPEIIPFAIKQEKKAKAALAAQEESRQELDKFIPLLEKAFREKLIYIGCDVIGEKYYERYLFEKQGFFEIMMEAPLAMNAHFADQKRAKNFAAALKKALRQVLPKKPVAKMLVDNIKHASEETSAMSVQKWTKIKGIRNL